MKATTGVFEDFTMQKLGLSWQMLYGATEASH